MRIFNLFKKKKKEKNVEIKIVEQIKRAELIPNSFTTVSKKQFEEEISKHFDLNRYSFGLEENEVIQIYLGNLTSEFETINQSENLLVIGNIETNWVNLTKKNYNESGGSLFVTGDVVADYFSGDFQKFILINGSLIIKKIINIEFEDSLLNVKGDLITEYFHGVDICAEVDGKIEIEYGDGYCVNSENKSVLPKKDIESSLDFLKIGEGDRHSTKINEIIKTTANIGYK